VRALSAVSEGCCRHGASHRDTGIQGARIVTGGHRAGRRIPDNPHWVAHLAETLGWSEEQADEWLRVPDEILDLITADLAATLGWSRVQGEEFVAQNAGEWAAGVPRVVLLAESVQQRLHDDRVDTSWPACPKHPRHPLRLRRGPPVTWTCPSTDETVCGLGNLASVIRL
jgi:hypothetical protein